MSHVFICYVHENREIVNRLRQELESFGITVWIDSQDLPPGVRIRQYIQQAIQEGAFFIACFSSEYHARERPFMNIELNIAIDELQRRPDDRVWFIPVKLNDCEIPNSSIGGGETLRDLVYVNLYENWNDNIARIRSVIQSGLTSQESDDQSANIPRPVESTIDESSDTSEGNSQEVNSIIAVYTNVIDLNPRHAEAYKRRGDLYLNQGEYERALVDFDTAIAIESENESENAMTYYRRGCVYMQTEDNDRALADFNKAIELNPTDVIFYLACSHIYGEEGEYERAISACDQMIELEPQNAIPYYQRGRMHVQRRDNERALTDFNKAIALSPTDAEVYYIRGHIYLERNQYELAIQDFDKAMELNPDHDEAIYYLAEAKRRKMEEE